jgi:iron-sulfur cluster assembly accessory protein
MVCYPFRKEGVRLFLTPAAIAKIKSLPGPLRIALRPGGCCGTYYHFEIALPKPGDLSFGMGEVTIHLKPDAAEALQGACLDWGPTLKPPRFRVLRNPNTPHKCPCGRSFGRPWPGRCQPACQAYVPMPLDGPGQNDNPSKLVDGLGLAYTCSFGRMRNGRGD